MLAEGHQQMQQQQSASPTDTGGNKRRLRALQEAMYHSAENDHLGKILLLICKFNIRCNIFIT